MASILRPRRAAESRSGGKIVRTRRTAAPRTPYDRPRLPPNPDSENPNWFSKLISSPTRMIATGAGKILSSVFTNDSSSSGTDSSSEDDFDDDSDDNDITEQAADAVKKNEQQPIVKKSETKHLIEQLLMQETFSREECDRLTSIINSRVVERPSIRGSSEGKLSEPPNKTVFYDADMPDGSSTAVMEAKRWLETKKLVSNSKSELEFGTCSLNSAILPHATENEMGSPVDMAKLYMQTRPPWASPSANHTEYKSPSSSGIQLFKEDTPNPISCTWLSSSKIKRQSPSSWNILDEIRKVRSKATEEMLRTRLSSRIDLSAFTSKQKSALDSLVADEVEASMKDKIPCSINYANESLDLAAGVSTPNGFAAGSRRGSSSFGYSDSQVAQDGIRNEALSPNPATLISEQTQSMKNSDDIHVIEGTKEGKLRSGEILQSLEHMKDVLQSDAGALNTNRPMDTEGIKQPFNTIAGGKLEGDQCCSTSKGFAKTSHSYANDAHPSGSSSSSSEDRQQKSKSSNKKDDDKNTQSIPVDMSCGFLTEASVEVPVTYENTSIPTCSQNSSSLHLDLPRPKSKRSLAGKANGDTEKQPAKKVGGYSRRGRGRGKKMQD